MTHLLVIHLCSSFEVSQRRAGEVIGVDRSSVRYLSSRLDAATGTKRDDVVPAGKQSSTKDTRIIGLNAVPSSVDTPPYTTMKWQAC